MQHGICAESYNQNNRSKRGFLVITKAPVQDKLQVGTFGFVTNDMSKLNENIIESSILSNSDNRVTYTVDEIAKLLGIGRNKAYQLVDSDEFKVIRLGKSIRVVKSSFHEWLLEKC